jgi:uncharacterized Fe-S cluster-containing radical SAM superfamily protein
MKGYVRFVTPNLKPFDPVLLAAETTKIVCKGDLRKYTNFVIEPEYEGIVTGYTCGCSLRCVFCGADWSRDYPEKYGDFYSPKDVLKKIYIVTALHGLEPSKTRIRISGAEPTICKEHLLKLLEYVEDSEFRIFILETNGTLLGIDSDYVQDLSRFKKIHVRVSLKAGTPLEFERKTGAIASHFEVPFQAIRNLIEFKVSFSVAAVTDPRLMNKEERECLIRKLRNISTNLNLEEEVMFPYPTTIARLKYAGLNWHQFLIPSQLYKVIKSHNKAFRYFLFALKREPKS